MAKNVRAAKEVVTEMKESWNLVAKIQRVQQKIPGCWTYVQQNENKFQKVCINAP
jgi:hypothetical protein